MVDCTKDSAPAFEFTYSSKQNKEIEEIRRKYLPKEVSKVEQVIQMDKKVEWLGTMASILIGTLGTLLFGIGMSCIMVLGDVTGIFSLGIVIGTIGIVIMTMAYPVYKKVIKKQRAKIATQMITICNEILNETK